MIPCHHDWRRNPHAIFTSIPPKVQHVCVYCGAKRYVTVGEPVTISHDPKDWPKA